MSSEDLDRVQEARKEAATLRSEVSRLRAALEKVVTFHGDMVHGEDCPIRLCEYGDCEHEDEDDCEAHEDECECCLGVAWVARRALLGGEAHGE